MCAATTPVLHAHLLGFVIRGSLSPRAWRVLRLRMEERFPIWTVAANILNKQPRTAEKGGSPALGLGEVLTPPHLQNVSCYGMLT